MMGLDDDRVAHIFGQACWHDEARIIANRPALVGILKAITDALGFGRGKVTLMPEDGESFDLRIKLLDKPFGAPEWREVPAPYTEPARWPLDGEIDRLRRAIKAHQAAVASGLLGKAEQDAADQALWAAATPSPRTEGPPDA